MDDLDKSKRTEVQMLRRLITDTHPELTEHIKWNSPSYLYEGEDRITFNVRDKSPLMIILHMGATRTEDRTAAPIVNDTSGIVEWKSDTRGVVSFAGLDDIENKRKLFTEVLGRWLATT